MTSSASAVISSRWTCRTFGDGAAAPQAFGIGHAVGQLSAGDIHAKGGRTGGNLDAQPGAGPRPVQDDHHRTLLARGEIQHALGRPQVHLARGDGNQHQVGHPQRRAQVAFDLRRRVDQNHVEAALELLALVARPPGRRGRELERAVLADGLQPLHEPAAKAALRVGVQHGDPEPLAPQGDGKVHGQRRLARAALLLRHGDDPSRHAVPAANPLILGSHAPGLRASPRGRSAWPGLHPRRRGGLRASARHSLGTRAA